MTALPPNPPTATMNKAHAGAASVVLAEAVAQIAIKILNTKWPGFVDDVTGQSIATIIVALITWASVYFTPPGN